ncbi:MAG: aminoglycoside phosphotransferase family protein [Coxiellaceae bacterium]|nr:aminoglycoside phosphotransferase family protein [Coxiellaceae bacterium]
MRQSSTLFALKKTQPAPLQQFIRSLFQGESLESLTITDLTGGHSGNDAPLKVTNPEGKSVVVRTLFRHINKGDNHNDIRRMLAHLYQMPVDRIRDSEAFIEKFRRLNNGEIELTKLIGKHQLGPKVIGVSEDERYMAVELAPGKTISTNELQSSPGLQQRCIAQLAALHNLPIPANFHPTRELTERTLFHAQLIAAKIPELAERIYQQLNAIENHVAELRALIDYSPTIMHGDINLTNILVSTNAIQLIDNVDGGCGDPYADIAKYVVKCLNESVPAKTVLTQYLSLKQGSAQTPTDQQLAYLDVMIQMQKLCYALTKIGKTHTEANESKAYSEHPNTRILKLFESITP